MITILSLADNLWAAQWKSELRRFLQADTKKDGEGPAKMSAECPYCGRKVGMEDLREQFFMGKICNQCFRERIRTRKTATDLAEQCLKNLYYIYGIKPWKKIKIKVKFRWWDMKNHQFPIHDADVKYQKWWKPFHDKMSVARGLPALTAEGAVTNKLLEQYIGYQLSKAEATVKKAEKAEKKVKAAKQKAEKEQKKVMAAKQKAGKAEREAEAARWRAEKAEKKAEKEEKKIETAKREIERAEKEIKKAEQEIEKREKEIEKEEKGTEATKQEIERAEKEIDKAEKEIERIEKEIERAENEAKKIDKGAKKVNKEVKKAEKEAEKAKKKVERAEKKAGKAEKAEKEAEAVKKEAEAARSEGKEIKGLCLWCTIHYLYIVKSHEHAKRYEDALSQKDRDSYWYWRQEGLYTPMSYKYLQLDQVIDCKSSTNNSGKTPPNAIQ